MSVIFDWFGCLARALVLSLSRSLANFSFSRVKLCSSFSPVDALYAYTACRPPARHASLTQFSLFNYPPRAVAVCCVVRCLYIVVVPFVVVVLLVVVVSAYSILTSSCHPCPCLCSYALPSQRLSTRGGTVGEV